MKSDSESILNSPLYDDEIVKSIASTISRTTTCATETELRKTKNEIIEEAEKVQFRTSGLNFTEYIFYLRNQLVFKGGTANLSIERAFRVTLKGLSVTDFL